MFKKTLRLLLFLMLALQLLPAAQVDSGKWLAKYQVPVIRIPAAPAAGLRIVSPEKLPVNYGGKFTFDITCHGSGQLEVFIDVFDRSGKLLNTFSRRRGIPRNPSTISMPIRVDGGWNGTPAFASVGIKLAPNATAEISSFAVDYDAKAANNLTIPVRRPETGAQNVDKLLTAQAAKLSKPSVMFLGDSITANWTHDQKHRWPGGGEVWQKLFAASGAVNFGVSGDGIENLLWRVTKGRQLVCQPQNIVLLIGTNNLWDSTAKEVIDGIDNLLNAIKRESPASRIHLLGILPRNGDYPVAYVNSQLKKIAAGRAEYHDFSSIMQPSLDDPAVGLYKEDGLHLTLKGYDTLGNAIKGVLPAEVVKAREFEIHQIYLDNVIGDAYIFIAPDGKITLLDGGDSPQYKTCLRPALDRLGIRHIHQVIITHMHWDHYGSVIELLADKDISVDKILWQTDYDWNLIKKSEPRAFTAYQIHMRKLRNNAKSRGVPLVELKLTDVLDFGSGAKGKILYGCDRKITANYINNQSLVFRFLYGDRSILFTGDMGFEEEAAILATGANVKSDIYKAAHHSGGGSNSENFVRAVAPDFAIAPQPEFLYSMKPGIESGKRINNCGVKIFYAHEFRELCLKTDGKKFTVWNGDKEITVDDITK